MHTLQLLFGILGNATALFLFLSPTITFLRIIKNKATEKFSCIPYVMTLLNCLLAGWYGLPIVTRDNTPVAAINGVGIVLEGIYVITFMLHATKKDKGKIIGLLCVVLAIFTSVALISVFAFHGYTRKLFVGVAVTVFSTIMYASPLSIMRVVIKTKSVEYMPFHLSLSAFLCGTSWLIYGILGDDLFVAIPNGVGSGLGAIQLILYFMYCGNKGDKKDMQKETSMELGGPTKPSEEEKQEMAAKGNASHALEQV